MKRSRKITNLQVVKAMHTFFLLAQRDAIERGDLWEERRIRDLLATLTLNEAMWERDLENEALIGGVEEV